MTWVIGPASSSGKYRFATLEKFAVLLILIGVISIATGESTAQTWPRCLDNCNSKDVEIQEVWLVLDGGECLPGENAQATLWARFNFKRQNTYCVLSVVDIYTGDPPTLLQANYTTFLGDYFNPKGVRNLPIGDITWSCGEELKLDNILILWDINNGDPCPDGSEIDPCSKYNAQSKCYQNEAPFEVNLPPTCSISCDPSSCFICPGESVTLTVEVTDGKGPFTYVWMRNGTVIPGSSSSIVVTEAGEYSVNVTDSHNRHTTCSRYVEIDEEPPEITCPGTINVECTDDVPSEYADLNEFLNAGGNATDNGGINESSFVMSGELDDGKDCPKTITRTYQIADICDNVATCNQTITVNDTTPPELTCPDAINVECIDDLPSEYANLNEFLNAGGNATDNCGINESSFVMSEELDDGKDCPKTITRTYQIADICDNIATCNQTITVNDTTPPELICPDAINVECIDDVPSKYANLNEFLNAGGNATDNCEINESSFVMLEETDDGKSCPKTITRTYQIADICDNIATCTQTIIVDDTISPELTCPGTINVECIDDVPSEYANLTEFLNAGGNATDNCEINESSFVMSEELDDGNNCPKTITRTYQIADICDNIATCAQTIIVNDTTLPQITKCPPAETFQCVEGTTPPENSWAGFVNAGGNATDNCDENLEAGYEDGEPAGVCPITIIRTWTVTDDCGNSVSCEQNVTIDDDTPPKLSCIADVIVDCGSVPDPANVTATDNCDPNPSVEFNETRIDSSCIYNYTLIRTWNATDICGNSALCNQTITVQDMTPPSISCPPDITIGHNESTDPSNTGRATAEDNCDPDPEITYNDSEKIVLCTKVITRTWTATDDCGNFAECIQNITIGYNSGISVVKTANMTSNVTVGDLIEYTIWVNNTGTVPLNGVQVTDPHLDLDDTIEKLDPNQNKSYVLTYKVTEGDICKPIENTVTVETQDPCSEEGPLTETSSVTVGTYYSSGLSITKEANVTSVATGDVIGYNITITNVGNVNLTELTVEDKLTELEKKAELLRPGESKYFYTTYVVNETDICDLIENNATVTAADPCGNVINSTTGTTIVDTTYTTLIEVDIEANVTEVEVGDVIGYTINVTNAGDVTVVNLGVSEILTGNLPWVILFLGPGATESFRANYTVTEEDIGSPIVNTATVTYSDPCVLAEEDATDTVTVNTRSREAELEVNKTALQKSVEPGDEIVYIITVHNRGEKAVHNVVVKDVFKSGRQKLNNLSATPEPDEGNPIPDGASVITWTFDNPIPGNGTVTIKLRADVEPRQDFEFEMGQGIKGEGFVNVANDYSTTFEPYVIKNCVYASSDETLTASDCEHVTVVADIGTELSTREHGSGTYESDELVTVRTENKSIEMDKDISATHKTTSVGLYNNRTVTYSSRWTEDACAKNRVTGTSMHESYRYATSIDRNSHMKLDKNESEMEVEAEFDGKGHIGFFKLSDPNCSCPFLEASEDYTGSFRVYEKVSEYGSSVESEKSTSGTGLVVVDKHVGDKGCKDSQRSYESGTGSYDSEEQIQTYTNYIAKDISLVHEPMSQSLTDETGIDSDLKWKEGMNSKIRKTSFIGEEYNSIERLDKETVARGLNEMETEAEFSGKASYRVVLQPDRENRSESHPPEPLIDLDEEYTGDYSIHRKIHIAGIPKYDHPHMDVTKTGELHYLPEETLVKYTITLENDGNKDLGDPLEEQEISVKDIFPSGAVYVNSSKEPKSLTTSYVLWNLTHLNIGDVATITLLLDVTDIRTDELVNLVEAVAEVGNETIIAKNVSAIELDWLKCCPADPVTVKKTGVVNPERPSEVLYRIEIESKVDHENKAKVTDTLPDGMILLNTSVPFSSYKNGVLTWNVIDLLPYETTTISYRVEALRNGRFMNSVTIEPYSSECSDPRPRYASSIVDVDGVEDEMPCPGWQPPDWDFQNVGGCGAADMTCEEIVEMAS